MADDNPIKRHSFLTAEWRFLVMLNYEIAPAAIAPFVPADTVLDLFDGRALISVVGFRFLNTRVKGIAFPFHQNFDEVNLRLYVRRELSDGEIRRGVVFVRELVPRFAIAAIAKLAYNEPYRSVPMKSVAPSAPTESPGRVQYAWRTSGHWQHVGALASGEATIPDSRSEAAFVTEHYWGYTRQRDGGTIEYQVIHQPWRVWNATEPTLDVDIPALYGSEFADALSVMPRSAFIAEGSPIAVDSPHRIANSPTA